jgi:hypothetical protein
MNKLFNVYISYDGIKRQFAGVEYPYFNDHGDVTIKIAKENNAFERRFFSHRVLQTMIITDHVVQQVVSEEMRDSDFSKPASFKAFGGIR